MGEGFREKVFIKFYFNFLIKLIFKLYLNDDFEELKYLRSISNSRVGSRSPRYLSHSPRPNNRFELILK